MESYTSLYIFLQNQKDVYSLCLELYVLNVNNKYIYLYSLYAFIEPKSSPEDSQEKNKRNLRFEIARKQSYKIKLPYFIEMFGTNKMEVG